MTEEPILKSVVDSERPQDMYKEVSGEGYSGLDHHDMHTLDPG